MNFLVYGLIAIPLLAALVVLLFKDGIARKITVYFFCAVIAIGSIAAVAMNVSAVYTVVELPEFLSAHIISYVFMGVGVLLSIIVLCFGIKYKNIPAIVIAVIQLGASLAFELLIEPSIEVQEHLYFDSLSLIMVAIIGVIGCGIIVYALGYMKDFSAHLKEGEKDRSNRFFALMFVFISAMFLIVLSNNMTWLFTGWEVTTTCSFLLIGYTKTPEAIKNSFRQIIMNMLGGIAFVGAMYFSATSFQTLELQTFITSGYSNTAALALPACLFAFAGITKAAQMPFHTWLLGAMVAPTPTSALLHSSTMVKAGVFLIIKLCPVFTISLAPQLMVMIAGGITFLLCSFMAISQSNAKRVLAYSTIANLGLIVACAGVGTPDAMWAAIFLIVFHACAKSLLFLCVGTAEHHIGSRDIEDMDALFNRMPRLARLMMLGIMGMFVAPFGMLVAKWIGLVSFINASQILLIIILAFGSAATFMYYAKWMGKLSGIVANSKNVEKTVHKSEWIAVTLMSFLVIATIIAMPIVSDYMVTPYIYDTYVSNFGQMGSMLASSLIYISVDMNTYIFNGLIVVVMLIVLLVGVGQNNKKGQAQIYLAGASVDNENRIYQGSMGKNVQATAKNWYLTSVFGEKKISPIGSVINSVIYVCAGVIATLAMLGIL